MPPDHTFSALQCAATTSVNSATDKLVRKVMPGKIKLPITRGQSESSEGRPHQPPQYLDCCTQGMRAAVAPELVHHPVNTPAHINLRSQQGWSCGAHLNFRELGMWPKPARHPRWTHPR